jgi:hypothetical protein
MREISPLFKILPLFTVTLQIRCYDCVLLGCDDDSCGMWLQIFRRTLLLQSLSSAQMTAEACPEMLVTTRHTTSHVVDDHSLCIAFGT